MKFIKKILNRIRSVFLLLECLTFRRIWNGVLLYASWLYSRISGNPVHLGYPFAVSVEPVNFCNLKCPECPAGNQTLTRKKESLDYELFKSVVDQLYKKTFYLNLYFQGEPYLYDRFFDSVKYARARKMFVMTSTNGHFLDRENSEKTVKSGLSRLIISMDGTTQEVYKSYRIGGNLEKVKAGINELVEMKKKLRSPTPEIVIQFLVSGLNEHQVDEMKKFAGSSGADKLEFKSIQVYQFSDGSPLIPQNRKYSRYEQCQNGKFRIRNSFKNRCRRLWTSSVMTIDGTIIPCCFDKDAKYPAGKLADHSFQEIWEGNSLKNFRKKVFSDRQGIDICTNCTEGTRSL